MQGAECRVYGLGFSVEALGLHKVCVSGVSVLPSMLNVGCMTSRSRMVVGGVSAFCFAFSKISD